MRIIKKLYYILTPGQKWSLAGLLMGIIFCALLDTAAVALMMPFMSAVVDPAYTLDNKYMSAAYQLLHCRSNADFLGKFALFLAAVYLFRGAFRYFINYVQAHMTAKYRTDMSAKLFSYVMNQPYRYHVNHNSALVLRLVTSDVNCAFGLLGQIILFCSSSFVSLGILAVLLSVDFKLTIGSILLLAVLILLPSRIIKRKIKASAQLNFNATANALKWVQQAMGGLKEILVKHRQPYFIRQYAEAARDTATATGDYNAWDALPKAFVETASMVAIFLIVRVTIAANSTVSMVPLFATFALAATRLIPVINQILQTINIATYYGPNVDAVYQLFKQGGRDLKSETKNDDCADGPDAGAAKMPEIKALQDGISIDHLSFRFEGVEENLFTDVSLFIRAGESTALVGTTGSGKTTLVDLILGLQQPTAGTIRADGRDVAQESDWWAEMIGYIPQFIYLCDDTIRANVAFGIPDAEVDEARVRKCLKDAQVLEFVDSLPEGLDTMTGENGMRLSGGQRQRIGIARALYTDPQVLVMDEATSALDNATEQAIVDALNALSGEKTLIVIAHRTSSIQSCKRIFRVEHGEVSIEK